MSDNELERSSKPSVEVGGVDKRWGVEPEKARSKECTPVGNSLNECSSIAVRPGEDNRERDTSMT